VPLTAPAWARSLVEFDDHIAGVAAEVGPAGGGGSYSHRVLPYTPSYKPPHNKSIGLSARGNEPHCRRRSPWGSRGWAMLRSHPLPVVMVHHADVRSRPSH
jgi:hypothetical protein